MKINTEGKSLSQIRAEAGRMGGRATLENHGADHFSTLANRMHRTYKIEPFMQNDYALVHRKTGEVKALLSGEPVPEFLKGESKRRAEDKKVADWHRIAGHVMPCPKCGTFLTSLYLCPSCGTRFSLEAQS